MNLRVMRYLGFSLVALAAACKEDPTASLAGKASAIFMNPNPLFVTAGDSGRITVQVLDETGTPLTGSVTPAASAPTVISVAAAPVPLDPTGTTSVFQVKGLAAGPAYARFTGLGRTDSTRVNVMPVAFDGTASTTSPVVGQPLTLNSTSLLKFASAADIDFGGGVHGIVTNRTADLLTVLVPQPDAPAPGPFTVSGIAVSYAPGFTATLPTSTGFDAVVNPYDPNDAPDPAATVTIPGAGGAPTVLYDGFQSSEVDNFYSFTLSTTTTFTVQLDWSTVADIDILFCDAGCNNFVGNFDGATAANPELATVTLNAGTYNLWINVFDPAGEPAHIYKITVTNP